MASKQVDVVVIGGGLAGLAAALELKQAGARVVVIEQQHRLGGKVGTAETAVGSFPTGPVSFNGRVPAFWRLLKLLKLEDQVCKLHPNSSARFIVRDGQLQAIRPNPLSVLTTGALTWSDKWAMVKDLMSRSAPRVESKDPAQDSAHFVGQSFNPSARRRNSADARSERFRKRSIFFGFRDARALEHADPTAAVNSCYDESLDAFLVRRFGRDAVDHFFAAVFTGIFAGDLRRLSAAACMPALVAAEREYGSVVRGLLSSMRRSEAGTRPGLYTLPAGLGAIGERAASQLDTRLGCVVTQIARTGTALCVRTSSQGALIADSVVLAVEAFAAAKLLQPLAPEAAKYLASFQYAPITLVQWAEASPGDSRLPLGFGYLAAPVEQCFALGTLFIADLLGESPRRFSTFIGGALTPERAAKSDEELILGVAEDLHRLTGGTIGSVAGIVRWPTAVFQPAPGHLDTLDALTSALQGLPVALAGSYFGGAAMKDALASGFAAAESLTHRKIMGAVA